jgi:hypothetical protein
MMTSRPCTVKVLAVAVPLFAGAIFLPNRIVAVVCCISVFGYTVAFLGRGRISISGNELLVRGALQTDHVRIDEITRVDADRFAMEAALLGLLPMLTVRIAVHKRLGARFTPFFWHSGSAIVKCIRDKA